MLNSCMLIGQSDADLMTLFKEPSILEIAERLNVSIGQALVSWAVQRGTTVAPKSEKEERIKQNILP